MSAHFPTRRIGFTLIELLVVISIITLLGSIVFSALNSARMKARNAVRLSAFNTLQTALKSYEISQDKYPLTSVSNTHLFFNGVSVTPLAPFLYQILSASTLVGSIPPSGFYSWADFGAATAPHLTIAPRDPLNNGTYYYYYKIFVDESGNPATMYYKENGPGLPCQISITPAPSLRPIRGYVGVRLENVAVNNSCVSEYGLSGWQYFFLE
ncbi:MAG: prepilin-type N-terminal cleavage/methylation domain-containing protein [Candidatus Sungbacteria bacterium]|nr:prepilin-type N-terminal cleavage/methylation domain-containing protein [Candidatus Sungbacteria bacterium]